MKCVDNSGVREAEIGGVLVFNTHPGFFFLLVALHSRPERTIAYKEKPLVPEEGLGLQENTLKYSLMARFL